MSVIREKHDGTVPGVLDNDRGRANVRLWLRLLSCTMVVEKRLKRRFSDRFDTTLPRFDVLAALDRHPDGMTMGALSKSLLVSNGNVTALVQTLIRDGSATLASSPGDRRTSIVALTPVGRTRFEMLAAAHHGWIDNWLGGLDGHERVSLYGLLGKLKHSIAEDHP